MKNLELQKRANDVRKGIVTAVHGAKAGHPGGSLSAADIFTFLYFEEMNIDPKNPDMEERDRFVLSKGHTAPGLYSALAYRGYFPVEDLPTLRHLGSYLQGHPCIHIPGRSGRRIRRQRSRLPHPRHRSLPSTTSWEKMSVSAWSPAEETPSRRLHWRWHICRMCRE